MACRCDELAECRWSRGRSRLRQFRLVFFAKLHSKLLELDIIFDEVQEIHNGAMFRLATGLPFYNEFSGKLFQKYGFAELVVNLRIETFRF